jgi:hypothetical protein
MNSELAVFIEQRDETQRQLDAALAALPAARAEVATAKEAAFLAGKQYGNIGLRVTRAVRSAGSTPPALVRILDEYLAIRDSADSAHTRAKNRLTNIEWRISCLREDVSGLDRLITPPPIDGGPRLEIVKRPAPAGQPSEIETIVFPAGIRPVKRHRCAGIDPPSARLGAAVCGRAVACARSS